MSLSARVKSLEKASGAGDRVIVIEREGQLSYHGQHITLEAYEALSETHDILLIHIVHEGDEDANKTGGLTCTREA